MYNLVTDNALLLSVGEIVFMIDGFLRVRRWRVRVKRENHSLRTPLRSSVPFISLLTWWLHLTLVV